MTPVYYKWLNGREATHVAGFRYRLRVWTPRIGGELVACERGYHVVTERNLREWIARDLFVAEVEGDVLDAGDKYVASRIRIVQRLDGWSDRTARLFAADCAERVLPIFEKHCPGDDRPRLAIQAARDFANGLIGEKELDASEAAAWAASRAASRAASEDAAWAASMTASRAASEEAAWVASMTASKSAEREWQNARILDYAHGRIA